MFSLISAELFAERLSGCHNICVLDARTMQEYSAGHVPGAQHVAWEEWCENAPASAPEALYQAGYWGRLPDPHSASIEHKLAKLGFGNDTPIVVYADGYRSKGREGRIAWMLLYLGARDVSIVNGGWRAWQRLSAAPERPQSENRRRADGGSFSIVLDEPRRAFRADVEEAFENNPNQLLIDTRGTREFAGRIYDYQPRLGTIPGSINLPYRCLLSADATFLERDEYLQLLEKHFVRGCDFGQSIWYCEVGVRAAMAALLHEHYTGTKVAVYDGSFMEWALDQTLPVIRTSDADGDGTPECAR